MAENIQQHQEETFQLPADGRMVLRTENLVKKYGKRTVVSHVSINVKQGESWDFSARTERERRLRFT